MKSLSHGVTFNLIAEMLLEFFALGFDMYFISLFGTNISIKFYQFTDLIYDIKWYKYSGSLQLYILLIIQNSQQIRYLTGLKIFYCNLETFMQVNGFIFIDKEKFSF